MSANRITIERPGFTPEQTQKIQKASVARIRCKFDEAYRIFEELLKEQTDEFHKVWVQNQLIKTMYACGRYSEALTEVSKLVE